MFDTDDIQQVLSNIGVQSLGFGNPGISVHWTTVPGTVPVEGAAGTLSLVSTDNWVAPAGGILVKSGGTDRLLQTTGLPVDANALVFRLHPFIFLRIQRFYSTIIEGLTAVTQRPERPVPYYFVYVTADDTAAVEGGKYNAGDDLGFTGTLTIHDELGLPIDPVAAAGALEQIVNTHTVLEDKDLMSDVVTAQANRQIFNIGQIGANQTIAHLVNLYGQPYAGADVQNVTAVANGVNTVNNAGNAIDFVGGAAAGLRLGPATNGTMGTTYTIRAAAGGIALNRDFVRVYVEDLEPHLIGTVTAGDAAIDFEERPDIRHNETVTFSFNGNATMGVANTIIGGTPDDAFVVSPVIEGDFDLPADGTVANSQWPSFPTGTPATSGAIAASIKDNFNPVAHFLSGSDEDADVVVTISGFTEGQAVRAYNRKFLPDAREGRGDGAGAVAQIPSGGGGDGSAQVCLVLTDPLGLKSWGGSVTLPTDPTLHLDLVVVNGDNTARVFGNVTCTISAPAALSAAETALIGSETNGLTGAEFRSISSAGILGIEPPTTSPSGTTMDVILSLLSEGNPRDSPRMPTMARRDCIIASRTTTTFDGQLSGMHAVKASRSAINRLGSPGGHGGKEFHVVSAQTTGGPLAYDINRAAFRRAKNVIERLVALGDNNWNEPAAAAAGTISAAVLQTIASGVETPELALFTNQISTFFTDNPAWSDIVDWLEEQLDLDAWPDFIGNAIETQLDNLRTSPNANRLYDEFKREFCSCAFGRRDAYWALRHAFENAREFVYIEGPAFARTEYGGEVANDLLNILKTRMGVHPGLRVIVAMSKELDYGPGYETFAAREYAKRQEAVDFIDALSTVDKKRIVAFHPMGFPGRPLRLMTNTVIVDDVFALMGSSTIRRRGMTFDGGQDMVLFDRTLVQGKSAAISTLRRTLMAAHLNAVAPVGTAMPDPDFVRLGNGNQAFEVFRELLEGGGAGLIESVWDGHVPGTPVIDPASFPANDVADPDGRDFDVLTGLLVAALAAAATPPAWP
ncbi:MAG: hypothetical protein H6581_28170 [Bacteroidia bacterium]|nr:hypothetical protein [Bacteroidia bacterium]